MHRFSSSLLILTLVLNSFLFVGCGNKTAKQKLAIYTANADAALVALTESVDRLNDAGRISGPQAKNVYQITLKVVGAVDVIRERTQIGYDQKAVLTIISTTLDDVRRAEREGVLTLTGKEREQFLKATFFAQFTIRSVQAVVEAVKEPPMPMNQMTETMAAKVERGRVRTADESIWTDLVLILQNAVIRGISQSRMTTEEALAEGAALSAELKESLNSKIAAL